MQTIKTYNISLDQFFESQSEFESGYSFMQNGAWEKAIVRFKKANSFPT